MCATPLYPYTICMPPTHTPLVTMSFRTLGEICSLLSQGQVRLGWWVAARHLRRSLISSCQSFTPEWSLLTRSHHCSGAPPGGLLLPLGRHLSTCFWMRWSGILQTCSSHCRRLCLSSFSFGRFSVFSMSCCVTAQVSAPYKRSDITNTRKARILVAMLRFRLQNSFLLHI